MKRIYAAYKLNWTESERGWGQRPDGFSLHSSEELAREYADAVMRKQYDDDRAAGIVGTPDCYIRPELSSIKMVRITPLAAREMEKNGGTVRVFGDANKYLA